MTSRKLYRSTQNKSIGGVCGGLGEYLDIDPTILRIIFVLAFLFAGTGPLLYIVLWLVIPMEPSGYVSHARPASQEDIVIEDVPSVDGDEA